MHIDDMANAGDALAAHDSLARNPPRVVGLDSLELLARRDSSCDDGSRHLKSKSWSHKRAQSIWNECNYLSRLSNAHAEGGAVEAPPNVIVSDIDHGSGVCLSSDGGPDEPSILMSRYGSVKESCSQLCNAGVAQGLNRWEFSAFVDIVIAFVDDELRTTRTTAGGERGTPTFTEAYASAVRNRVRLVEEARIEAGRRSSRSRAPRSAALVRSARRDSPRQRRSPSTSSSSSSSPPRDRTQRRRSPSPDKRPRKDKKRERRSAGDRSGAKKKLKKSGSGGETSDAPFGLCYAWAKYQVTKDKDDKCPKSAPTCRFAHEFRKASERKWAEKRYG